MPPPRAPASPASLKGVLAARQAPAALQDGFAHLGLECDQLPFADGGGARSALCDEWEERAVHDVRPFADGARRAARPRRRRRGCAGDPDPSGHDVMHASAAVSASCSRLTPSGAT